MSPEEVIRWHEKEAARYGETRMHHRGSQARLLDKAGNILDGRGRDHASAGAMADRAAEISIFHRDCAEAVRLLLGARPAAADDDEPVLT